MPWPAGQQNGGRPYREMKAKETGLLPGTVLTGGAPGLFIVPWGAEGFTDAMLNFQLNNAGPGGNTLQLQVQPRDSDGANLLGVQDLILPALELSIGSYLLQVAFDDSAIPGSYATVGLGGLITGGLTLNPTWNKNAAMLQFILLINGTSNTTVTDFNVALRG